MFDTKYLDMEKTHPPLQSLFIAEINRIYKSKTTEQPLEKVELESASIAELQQIAGQIPPEFLKLEDISAADLPKSFTLNNLTGQKISVAFLPISDHGTTLSKMDERTKQTFLADRLFIKTLFVDTAAQNLTFGFGENQGFFFDLNPTEIQADLTDGGTTFTVDKQFDNPEEAKKWYVEKYNQAQKNLLLLLLGPR